MKYSVLSTAIVAVCFANTLMVGLNASAAKKATDPAPAAPLKPLGNASAPQGGMFTINFSAEPSTLNPITGTDLYNAKIKGYVTDSLMERDPNTYEWIPALAEKFEISKDGKTYTFTLRKDATFSDGKAVTVEDVKFSFDVIFDPKYNAAQMRPYFEGIEKVEIVDPQTVRFVTKEKYFGNFETAAGMNILPIHFYGNADEGVKKNKTILGSGPYLLEKYDQGQSLTLVRNKKWWGNKVDQRKGEYNFERIRFRFIKDDNFEIETLKKGDLDYVEMTPEVFMKKTDGQEWGKSVFKVKTENLEPKPFDYIGWNLKRDLFKDKDVRLALAMLTNRAEMNQKFRYGMSLLATGPWYQQSEYADSSIKPIQFDPKKANALLKKAGWMDSDKNGILDKVIDGKKVEFHFSLSYANPEKKKYWELFQSDLKKNGIVMDLQQLDFNALLKSMDENHFDAVGLSWGGGSVDLDPKQIWHSSSAGKGGSNFINYSNPEVDKLIDQARIETDKKKRVDLLRKVYKTIAEDAPYDFLFNDKFVLYGRSTHVTTPKATYKFETGTSYWWAAAK